MRTKLLVMSAILSAAMLPAQTRAPGHPDFSGVWSSATATPLERPAALKDKAFFSKEEAADWERHAASMNEEQASPAPSRSVGTYNSAWREFGVKLSKTLRTSIITDPPDGKLPALTPAAAAEKQRRMQALRHPREAQDMGLQDQCLLFPTAVAPMIPYSYNSNYQFVDTGDFVMINVEMAHDTRIVAMDGRAHADPRIRRWLGDSIGHWEGSTLVVDTANFNDGGGFYGDAGGMFGWDRNLHVVERFSLLDANTLLYRFEVDDPTAYTRPWKGELTMSRAAGPIYEYACHEGNYALPAVLKNAAEARH
jgi:hypothetical protein